MPMGDETRVSLGMELYPPVISVPLFVTVFSHCAPPLLRCAVKSTRYMFGVFFFFFLRFVCISKRVCFSFRRAIHIYDESHEKWNYIFGASPMSSCRVCPIYINVKNSRFQHYGDDKTHIQTNPKRSLSKKSPRVPSSDGWDTNSILLDRRHIFLLPS